MVGSRAASHPIRRNLSLHMQAHHVCVDVPDAFDALTAIRASIILVKGEKLEYCKPMNRILCAFPSESA